MKIPIGFILKPVVSLQRYFFNRPRIDIDIVSNPGDVRGQRNNGASNQNGKRSLHVMEVIYDFTFYWNYIIRIKNNSTKSAYNLIIEQLTLGEDDFLETPDPLLALRENEATELQYKIIHKASMNGDGASRFLGSFPTHINQIVLILSYTNEARTKFYTKFTFNRAEKIIEHLIFAP
jgi:hypothetical protein